MSTLFAKDLEIFGYRLSFAVRVREQAEGRLRSRNEKVVKDYKSGNTIKNLSVKYDLTPGRISQILFEQGARSPRWNRMTSRQRRMVVKLGRMGMSKSEIGRQVGISRTRVRQILQDGGLDSGSLAQP